MRLTQWTDYSLRVLLYCAACEGRSKRPTVNEIAEAHGVSRSHLMKIVMTMAEYGWLETTRGRGGGLRLLMPPGKLTVGQIVRQTESDMTLVECFDPNTNTCRLDGFCRLKGVLQQASHRFLTELDGYTLADLMEPNDAARALKGQRPHLVPLQRSDDPSHPSAR